MDHSASIDDLLASDEAVVVHKPDVGTIEAMSESARSLFDVDHPDLRNLTVRDLLPDDGPFDADHAAILTDRLLKYSYKVLWRYESLCGCTIWAEVRLRLTELEGLQRVVAKLTSFDLPCQESAVQGWTIPPSIVRQAIENRPRVCKGRCIGENRHDLT
jgi:hypothetical protein